MHTEGLADADVEGSADEGARRGFRMTPFNALLVAGGLLVGVGAGWLAQGPGGSPAPPVAHSAPTAKSPSRPASSPKPSVPSKPPSPSTHAPRPVVPPDFAVVRDASGVTLAVPSGWRRSEAASVYYRAPGRGSAPYTRFLYFRPLPERNISATRALRSTAAVGRRLPGFELQALHPTSHGAAELVYSYDSTRTGQRLTLVQRVFTAPDGRRYAFTVVGPAAALPWQHATLGTVLAPFAVD